jgi:hypothetical protein
MADTLNAELDDRQRHLNNIDDVIQDIIKNKNIIQNIAVVWDEKTPTGCTDCTFSYIGNYNAVIGMYERHKMQELIRATMNAVNEK